MYQVLSHQIGNLRMARRQCPSINGLLTPHSTADLHLMITSRLRGRGLAVHEARMAQGDVTRQRTNFLYRVNLNLMVSPFCLSPLRTRPSLLLLLEWVTPRLYSKPPHSFRLPVHVKDTDPPPQSPRPCHELKLRHLYLPAPVSLSPRT